MGSQLLLSSVLQNTVRGSGGPAGLILQNEGPYDFYKEPNMCQARLCLPAIEQLARAVCHRLDDWPDHPALVQVRGGDKQRMFLVWIRFWWCAYSCSVIPRSLW